MPRLPSLLFAFFSATISAAPNFPFEASTLSVNPSTPSYLRPFNQSSPSPSASSPCRPSPSDASWPTTQEWAALNATVGGRLLRPDPPGIVCYPSAAASYNASACDFFVNHTANTRFWPEQPLLGMVEWAAGGACEAGVTPKGECGRGGLPEYVVNASSVADVQAAVNFAREKGVRLVVK
jgi:hypothetical protein